MQVCCEESFRSEQWVNQYLERIGYRGPSEASLSVLCELQERHLLSVPFENLDIVNGVPLSLEIEDLLGKIVGRRRGGFCFELNRLFGWLLRQMGFKVTDCLGWMKGETDSLIRRHHVLKVTLDAGSYLCDVGVGGASPLHPLELAEELVQAQPNGVWKLTREPRLGWMLNAQKEDGALARLYSFTEEPRKPEEFRAAALACEQLPESHFRMGVIAALRTENGRRTIDGAEFRAFEGNRLVSSFTPATQAAFDEALLSHLGVRLDE